MQNLEDDEAEIDIYVGAGEGGSGWTHAETITLAPKESMTLSADLLGVPSDGASVAIEGWLQREETVEVDIVVTCGDLADEEDLDAAEDAGCDVIDDELVDPDQEVEITVEVDIDPVAARIAAVSKHVSPVASGGAATSGSHITVDGYSALTAEEVIQDVMPWSDGTYIVPIVQTNDGWQTTLRVSNFNTSGGLTNVTVTLYGSGGQGFAGFSEVVNLQLRPGETGSINLSDHVPAEWVGSAYITSGADIGAVAERHKAIDSMLITTTSRPEHHADETHFGALIFKEYNYWNTGISVANVDDDDHNSVTITYYGPTMNQVGTDTLTIPPRGMEFVYLPGTQDLGLISGFVGSVVISGTHELVAAIDQVKYFGNDPDVGQAMSYVTNGDVAVAGHSLAMPLMQKGNPNTGTGDTSGIQLFNTSTQWAVDAEIVFYGANGLPVAPTVENNDADPMPISLGPSQSYTLYTHQLGELSSGFLGSAEITLVGGLGGLVGVSNNVNYGVAADGSSAFNLIRTEPRVATTLLLEPEFEVNTVGDDHTVTATLLDQFGAPVVGADIDFWVDSFGLPDPDFGDGVTDQFGQTTFTYTNTVVGLDEIWAEHGETGLTAFVEKEWEAGAPSDIILSNVEGEFDPPETEAENPAGTSHTVYAYVEDGFGNVVADGTLIDFEVEDQSDLGVVIDSGQGATTGGVASFTYDGPEAERSDNIVASFGDAVSNTVTKDWVLEIEFAGTTEADPDEFVPIFEPDLDSTITTTVTAQDQFGNPLDVPDGTEVCWTVTTTGTAAGTVDPVCDGTDSSVAETTLTITNGDPGDTLTIEATIEGEFDGGSAVVALVAIP